MLFKRILSKPQAYSFSTHYDLAVIGSGPGGYVAAIKAAQLGLKTACIDKNKLGGTCLNVGCIPSKALLNISHKYHDAQKNFKDLGIQIDNINVDWEQTLKKKQSIQDGLQAGIGHLFKKNKVDYITGTASLNNENKLFVDSEEISAKNILIATGSKPKEFGGIPFDEEIIISSTGALSLKKVPEQLLIVGAGVIGIELGSVYQRMGSKVTVIEYLDAVCPTLDKEISKNFERVLKKQGLKFHLSTKVVSIKSDGSKAFVEIEKRGKTQVLEGDHCLISTGRAPVIIPSENLALDKGLIVTDDNFRTNIENVYAIGDCIKGPMLAHKAEEEGVYVANYLAGQNAHMDYDCIPGVIYTHPEVATVGKTEEEIKAQGIDYLVGKFNLMANSRAIAVGDRDGIVKVIADKQTYKILGFHIVGANAGELIAEATLAMRTGVTVQQLAETCHSHPTISEALKEACMDVYDKPIHA